MTRKWAGLRWTSPSRALPHGLTGAVTLILGAKHMATALRGDLRDDKVQVLVYLAACLANALAGAMLVHLAPTATRAIFQLASALQVGLVWFATRFYVDKGLPAPQWLRSMDQLMVVAIIVPIVGFACLAAGKVSHLYGRAAAVSVAAGCVSMTLLCGYPLQLAFMDPTWYACVLDMYPAQRTGFVLFVYLPATFCFATMMFGATLLNRKIISGLVFGTFFVGFILVTLFATVLMQEVHIPGVSTQKLVILCPEPSPDAPRSLLQFLSETLDTSQLASAVLTRLA